VEHVDTSGLVGSGTLRVNDLDGSQCRGDRCRRVQQPVVHEVPPGRVSLLREVQNMEAQAVLDYGRDISLATADGLKLRARWLKADKDPTAVVVVAHGFCAHIEDPAVQLLATDLRANGFDVLLYDARGHAGSEGHSGIGSVESLDVAAAAAEARKRSLPIVLVGVSMGSIAVGKFLAEPSDSAVGGNVRGAVLVSAPAAWRIRPSVLGVVTATLTRTPLGRIAAKRMLRVRIAPGWRAGEPLVSVARRIDLPVAVVHGIDDRLLSEHQARKLKGTLGGPCRYEAVAGMGHGIDSAGRPSIVSAVDWVLEVSIAEPVGAV
jgi:uncharacterized protein